jgi:sec-independent protein translocase protein TatB
MLDIGWTELLVIGVVALIVVGPKDLPGMFRALGQFTGKIRRMARDFQRAMDEAADGSGLKETASGLKNMTSAKSMGLDKLKDAADRFDKWEPPKPKTPAPAGANTEKLRQERAAEAQKKLDDVRAAREAREAAAKASASVPHEPLAHVPRERPGAPTARAARPKNMPKKKPTRGRG